MDLLEIKNKSIY